MANRPANAGAHSAGPQQGPAAAPPPVHHQDFPRTTRTARITRTTRTARTARTTRSTRAASVRADRPGPAGWLPYLIVLAAVAAGLVVAWAGTGHAGRGTAAVGGALLVAAAARLLLPPRYAGLLASRGKALDVTIFAVLGAAVLGVALSLP